MKYKQRPKDVIEENHRKKLLLNKIFSMQLYLFEDLDSLICTKLFYNVYKIRGSLQIYEIQTT